MEEIIKYIDVGEGKPLVLLHGLGQCYKNAWKPQLELANKYRLIIPDLQGESNNITIENIALSIIKLLTKLKIKSAYIAGVSLGGIVAMEIQKQQPSLVTGMILCNSTPYIPSCIGNQRIDELSKLLHNGKDKLREHLAANSLHNQEYLEETMQTFNITDTYLECSKAPIGRNYSITCLKINKPTLLIGGLFDKVTTVYSTYALKMLITHAEIEIYNTGHLTNIEKRADFNNRVKEFIG